MRNRKKFYLDLVERAGWTFVQAGLAAWIVLGDLWAEDSLNFALTAGAIAVAKVVISSRLPWTASNSGSSLPEELDPPGATTYRNERGAVDVMTVAAILVSLCAVIWLVDRLVS